MGKKGAARTKKKPRSRAPRDLSLGRGGATSVKGGAVPVVHKHIAGMKYENITVN